MANTLTNLIPDVYAALDVVSREMVGMIPSVALDATASRAAVGQQVTVHQAPASSVENTTPGATPPDTGDQVFTNTSITITKSRTAPFRWTGEEQLSLNNGGPGYLNVRQDQIAQALRALTNEMEADLTALQSGFPYAYGAAATTPFASTLADSAQVGKILTDQGAPLTDRQLVIDTGAGANLRTLAQLTKVNEAGTASIRDQGILIPLHGMAVRESGQIKTHTAGTGASATTNNAGYAIGVTSITLAAAGTGSILAGDVITFAGDANKYVVATGDADVSGGGTIALVAPGLRQAIPASNTAITVVATTERNMAFHRNAIVLAARAPALPVEGDSAADRQIVVDPRSGLTFELAMYPQYRRMRYEISMAWGVALIKPAHTALLLG